MSDARLFPNKVVGLIPARGGSKGIPGKNLVPLLGKPLISYTCEAALTSRQLDMAIVSTDDARVAETAGQYGITEIHERSPALSTDDAPMVEVVRDVATWLDLRGIAWHLIVLLQPTSPLRTFIHIDEAMALLAQQDGASLVSVTRVSHRFVPSSLMTLDQSGWVRPLDATAVSLARRQEKPVLYARNGPAIVATGRESLEGGSLYADPCVGYVMSPLDSIDVDDADDLELAGLLLKRR